LGPGKWQTATMTTVALEGCGALLLQRLCAPFWPRLDIQEEKSNGDFTR
jgi:hypothetical protein